MTVRLTVRSAGEDDVALLAALNRQLIDDQRHPSAATEADLAVRMRRWIASNAYRVAVIDDGDEPVAYAVWRDDEDGIYVRQFFVVRHRRTGVGRAAFAAVSELWAGRSGRRPGFGRENRARMGVTSSEPADEDSAMINEREFRSHSGDVCG